MHPMNITISTHSVFLSWPMSSVLYLEDPFSQLLLFQSEKDTCLPCALRKLRAKVGRDSPNNSFWDSAALVIHRVRGSRQKLGRSSITTDQENGIFRKCSHFLFILVPLHFTLISVNGIQATLYKGEVNHLTLEELRSPLSLSRPQTPLIPEP